MSIITKETRGLLEWREYQAQQALNRQAQHLHMHSRGLIKAEEAEEISMLTPSLELDTNDHDAVDEDGGTDSSGSDYSDDEDDEDDDLQSDEDGHRRRTRSGLQPVNESPKRQRQIETNSHFGAIPESAQTLPYTYNHNFPGFSGQGPSQSGPVNGYLTTGNTHLLQSAGALGMNMNDPFATYNSDMPIQPTFQAHIPSQPNHQRRPSQIKGLPSGRKTRNQRSTRHGKAFKQRSKQSNQNES